MMIKARIQKGDFVLGTWCEIPSSLVINTIAKAGLDFVIVDMEHGPIDFKDAQDMVMAAAAEGCAAVIRVAENSESQILRALDTGASGIIVPHVKTVADVDKIVSHSKFAPVGDRGYNPYIRAGDYHGGNPLFFGEQNDKTLVAVIIEGVEGLHNLEQILKNPYVDVVYIGTYDLSVALGVAGEVKHEKVIDTLRKVVRQVKESGKASGCMIHDSNDLEDFKRLGIQFITYKTDTAIIYDAFNGMQKELKR